MTLKTNYDERIFITYVSHCYLCIFIIDYKMNNLPQVKYGNEKATKKHIYPQLY